MKNEKRKIIKEPNTVLHQRAKLVPVEEISSKKVQQVLDDMRSLLTTAKDGIGIAAPQVGYSLRIFLASDEAFMWDSVKNMSDEERKKKIWNYHVFINPVIKNMSSKKIRETEGCLSIPGTYGLVERAEKVTVEAYDEQGKKFQRGMSKLYARVMQHEIDHLNGMLFIEKAKNIKHIEKSK